MKSYEIVIGLEVHAQLSTASKLFCSCSTSFGAEPNVNVCEVCTGMPGVLPVLNAKAVEYAAKAALALGCTINQASVFARKNYFYPDLPKGYQISQYEKPLAENGCVEIITSSGTSRIRINRVHMEDDAGKNIHSQVENRSMVDLNRTGVPLIEIVSEPDLRSGEEAAAYLKVMHAILTGLGVCDGNMEEGSFRCDANISIRPRGSKEFGVRTELKNLNSFKFVQRAIEYEAQRQEDLIEDGGTVVQETRLFDTEKGVTRSMRGKEEASDYRYFPDPDLLPVTISADLLEAWKKELPELPAAKQARFEAEYELPAEDARLLASDKELGAYFEAALKSYQGPARKIANWIMTDLLREIRRLGLSADKCPFEPSALAALVAMVDQGVISMKVGKDILPELCQSGKSPEEMVKEKGLGQINDSAAIERALDEIIAANPEEAKAFGEGKDKLASFFVGQVMRVTKGKANPGLVNQLLINKLRKS